MYGEFIVKYLKNEKWYYESGFDLWELAYDWIREKMNDDYSIIKYQIIEVGE